MDASECEKRAEDGCCQGKAVEGERERDDATNATMTWSTGRARADGWPDRWERRGERFRVCGLAWYRDAVCRMEYRSVRSVP